MPQLESAILNTVLPVYEPSLKELYSLLDTAGLEKELLSLLIANGYEKVEAGSEATFLANLKKQLELLNQTVFSADEWDSILRGKLANPQDKLADRTQFIQEDSRFVIIRDDKSQFNVTAFEKHHVERNKVQFTNAFLSKDIPQNGRPKGEVTVLINGLPMVHIELKDRRTTLANAFRSIHRRRKLGPTTSWSLFEYVQLYVISNGEETKYYSNTTRKAAEEASQSLGTSDAHAKSFAFTSYWADQRNKPIRDLLSFAETFLSKNTILKIIADYCVFDTSKNLVVMRPYQITATEQILRRIITTKDQPELLGTKHAGGYVWHSTGSGKTLTSFKTAQLALEIDGIDKVIFVVDRQDLDYQTVKEYERLSPGAVSPNTNTQALSRQLGLSDKETTSRRIRTTNLIVTTIQKLNKLVDRKLASDSQDSVHYPGHVVLIFDECHRSQFGEMHRKVSEYFNKRHSFGFTGTPILGNMRSKIGSVNSTVEVFGDELHSYNIVDAIRDENVLKFKIETFDTKVESNAELGSIPPQTLSEADYLSDSRITKITQEILNSFNRYTKRDMAIKASFCPSETKGRSLKKSGFNALFATQSIQAACLYYQKFKELQESSDTPLKIAMIFSHSSSKNRFADKAAGNISEESFSSSHLPEKEKSDLLSAIADYDQMFGTSFADSSGNLEDYYKDLALRIQKGEVDLTIVVNMLLTGFNSSTLNTLFVDKELRRHGLIQAFSRTNRILNSVKEAGNIVTFRNLKKQTDEALKLYADPDLATKVALIPPYEELIKKYKEVVSELRSIAAPGDVIPKESDQRAFISTFTRLLRLRNVLTTFKQFVHDDPLSLFDFSDYQIRYIDLRTPSAVKSAPVVDDLQFELELVNSYAVNFEYIEDFIEGRRDEIEQSHITSETKQEVIRLIDTSPFLRTRKKLILSYFDEVEAGRYAGRLADFTLSQFESRVEQIIDELNLNRPDSKPFIETVFASGDVQLHGTTLTSHFPKEVGAIFGGSNKRKELKIRAAQALNDLINSYGGIILPEDLPSQQIAEAK